MLDKFAQRENLIFDTLQKFVDAQLDFVVIGGYGVSAYKHRFSINLPAATSKLAKFLFSCHQLRNRLFDYMSKLLLLSD